MFDKFIGKRKKEADIFHIPEKKYTTDQKIIAKMSTGALKDLFNDQEKYVNTLIEKLEHGKAEYDRLTDKVDELQEKNEVVNTQIARMTNEHEELTIKFDNLQTSLEIVSSENDLLFKKELAFLNEQEINCEKLKNLNIVLTFYRERLSLCKKIEMQNRNLKTRFSELEEELDEAKEKIEGYEKEKNYNNLIPSLMQEIQELRENNARAESKKQEDLQNHLSLLEQKLTNKVKSEIETVSTLKTTEEEDFDEKNRLLTIQLQTTAQELQRTQLKIKQLELKNQDLMFNFGKNSERIVTLQSQLARSTATTAKLEQELSQAHARYQTTEQKLSQSHQVNNGLERQINELKSAGNNIEDFLSEINTVLDQKRNQCTKLQQQLQIKNQELSSKQNELNREKENRESIEVLLSNKNNNEMEGLLKIKTKNQNQIQELRQSIDSLKRNISEYQAKIKQISEELESARSSNKRLIQEKLMIQQNANTCLKASQQEAEKIKALQKESKKKNQQFKKQLDTISSKLKMKEDEVKNLSTQTEKLFKALQTKEVELKKNYTYIQQLEKDKNNVNVMIGQKEEDNKIRIRKYESELNQERIKLESLNRKINNLESRAEENKTSMDNMYQQLLSKDKKIVHMETKLKEYKYIIQVQKKEKQELEDSYEKTISTLKPNFSENHKEEPTEPAKEVKQANQQPVDHQKENLKNQLLSIKEQNIVLLSQNEGLRKKIEELQDTIHEKSRNIKILQEKRDQIMKEIEKMNKKSANSNDQVQLHALSSPSIIRIESKEHEGRQKKIAAKAHKGFDILLKLQHQFYKNFINIFATELSRQQVKSIEGEINTIIKKSNDMKDIFEDYL